MYPIINDSQITDYLERPGNRLVESAPAEYRNGMFEYSFTPVNLKEINASQGGVELVNVYSALLADGNLSLLRDRGSRTRS